MFLSFGVLIFLCLLMGLSTRVVLGAFDKMAVGMTTKGKIAAASILVALSTSLPELFVTLASVIEKKPEIALGTLLGSNVADLSIIIGGATLLAGSLPIVGDYWRFELAAAFMGGISPILLMMDGGLSRMDGAILIVIYIIYLSDLVRGSKKKEMLFQTGKKKLAGRGVPAIEMVLGIIILLVSGIATAMLALSFLALPIISLVYGEKYLESVSVFRYLILAMIPFLFTIISNSALVYAFNQLDYYTKMVAIQTTIIVVVDLLLIPRLGYNAPAIALFTSNIFVLFASFLKVRSLVYEKRKVDRE